MSADIPLEISVTEASRLLTATPTDVRLIDVREPMEFEICQLPGSDFIPMRQIPDHLDELPKDKRLLILCHHGTRSMMVTKFLRSRGFSAVSNIAGGINAWSQEIDPSIARY